MSAVIVVPILIPTVTTTLWPVMAVAVTAAAVVLGFAMITGKAEAETRAVNQVALTVNNAEEVAGGLNLGETLAFERAGVRLTFARDGRGQMAVRVEGRGTDEELRAIGEQAAAVLVQQYAYHRLVSEMKAREMNVVGEQVEADGTVRLQVRVFQG